MSEPRKARAARVRRRRGQTIAEYAILVGFLVMALAAIFGAFPAALGFFWEEVSALISLPIL